MTLDTYERRVAAARLRVRDLVGRLVTAPIDRTVYAELREFLQDDADQACEAWDELQARGTDYQRRRLLALLGLVGAGQ